MQFEIPAVNFQLNKHQLPLSRRTSRLASQSGNAANQAAFLLDSSE
jgi:hypothetical protein